MVAVAVPIFAVDPFGFAVTLELEFRDEGKEEEGDDEEDGLFPINVPIPKLRFNDENHSFKNFMRKSTLTFSPSIFSLGRSGGKFILHFCAQTPLNEGDYCSIELQK